MTTPSALDSPVRAFLEAIAPHSTDNPDMDAIGRKLSEFTRDLDYLQHHIDSFDASRFGQRQLANTGPENPLLLLVHRPEGMMGAIHSHAVWVALAPILGTETHRHYEVTARHANGRADIHMDEERHLDAVSADFVTMTPPDDVHAHGHLPGYGESAYILVLTGRPQVQFERQEYDASAGTWRTLAPGDMGSPGQAL